MKYVTPTIEVNGLQDEIFLATSVEDVKGFSLKWIGIEDDPSEPVDFQ